ncbi:Borrelia P83 domain containing protein [Pyrenophora teres f. maculata]|nr:Borrelia P83 domain containing protein [Pyrenophora teres f. maculata]
MDTPTPTTGLKRAKNSPATGASQATPTPSSQPAPTTPSRPRELKPLRAARKAGVDYDASLIKGMNPPSANTAGGTPTASAPRSMNANQLLARVNNATTIDKKSRDSARRDLSNKLEYMKTLCTDDNALMKRESVVVAKAWEDKLHRRTREASENLNGYKSFVNEALGLMETWEVNWGGPKDSQGWTGSENFNLHVDSICSDLEEGPEVQSPSSSSSATLSLGNGHETRREAQRVMIRKHLDELVACFPSGDPMANINKAALTTAWEARFWQNTYEKTAYLNMYLDAIEDSAMDLKEWRDEWALSDGGKKSGRESFLEYVKKYHRNDVHFSLPAVIQPVGATTAGVEEDAEGETDDEDYQSSSPAASPYHQDNGSNNNNLPYYLPTTPHQDTNTNFDTAIQDTNFDDAIFDLAGGNLPAFGDDGNSANMFAQGFQGAWNDIPVDPSLGSFTTAWEPQASSQPMPVNPSLEELVGAWVPQASSGDMAANPSLEQLMDSWVTQASSSDMTTGPAIPDGTVVSAAMTSSAAQLVSPYAQASSSEMTIDPALLDGTVVPAGTTSSATQLVSPYSQSREMDGVAYHVTVEKPVVSQAQAQVPSTTVAKPVEDVEMGESSTVLPPSKDLTTTIATVTPDVEMGEAVSMPLFGTKDQTSRNEDVCMASGELPKSTAGTVMPVTGFSATGGRFNLGFGGNASKKVQFDLGFVPGATNPFGTQSKAPVSILKQTAPAPPPGYPFASYTSFSPSPSFTQSGGMAPKTAAPTSTWASPSSFVPASATSGGTAAKTAKPATSASSIAPAFSLAPASSIAPAAAIASASSVFRTPAKIGSIAAKIEKPATSTSSVTPAAAIVPASSVTSTPAKLGGIAAQTAKPATSLSPVAPTSATFGGIVAKTEKSEPTPKSDAEKPIFGPEDVKSSSGSTGTKVAPKPDATKPVTTKPDVTKPIFSLSGINFGNGSAVTKPASKPVCDFGGPIPEFSKMLKRGAPQAVVVAPVSSSQIAEKTQTEKPAAPVKKATEGTIANATDGDVETQADKKQADAQVKVVSTPSIPATIDSVSKEPLVGEAPREFPTVSNKPSVDKVSAESTVVVETLQTEAVSTVDRFLTAMDELKSIWDRLSDAEITSALAKKLDNEPDVFDHNDWGAALQLMKSVKLIFKPSDAVSQHPNLILLNTKKPAPVAEEKKQKVEQPQKVAESKGKERVEVKAHLDNKPLQQKSTTEMAEKKAPDSAAKATEKVSESAAKATEKVPVLATKATEKKPEYAAKATEKAPVSATKTTEKQVSESSAKATEKKPESAIKATEQQISVSAPRATETAPISAAKATEKKPEFTAKVTEEKISEFAIKATAKMPEVEEQKDTKGKERVEGKTQLGSKPLQQESATKATKEKKTEVPVPKLSPRFNELVEEIAASRDLWIKEHQAYGTPRALLNIGEELLTHGPEFSIENTNIEELEDVSCKWEQLLTTADCLKALQEAFHGDYDAKFRRDAQKFREHKRVYEVYHYKSSQGATSSKLRQKYYEREAHKQDVAGMKMREEVKDELHDLLGMYGEYLTSLENLQSLFRFPDSLIHMSEASLVAFHELIEARHKAFLFEVVPFPREVFDDLTVEEAQHALIKDCCADPLTDAAYDQLMAKADALNFD